MMMMTTMNDGNGTDDDYDYTRYGVRQMMVTVQIQIDD